MSKELSKLKKRELNRAYYLKNREESLQKSKEYYWQHKEEIIAKTKRYYQENKELIAQKNKYRYDNNLDWKARNREEASELGRNRWRKRRSEIFTVLGGELCAKCGFSDWRALQIDHINGGGNQHRKQFKAVEKYYQYVCENKDEFQVLCANCNRIKVHEEKEWRPRTREQLIIKS